MNERNLNQVYWLASNLAQSASSLAHADKDVLADESYMQIRKAEFNDMIDTLRSLIDD